jgi:hypothetical protein
VLGGVQNALAVDEDMARLLALVHEVGPTRRLPPITDIDHDRVAKLLGIASRNKWIPVVRSAGTSDRGLEALDGDFQLTPEGLEVLNRAIAEQGERATEPQSLTTSQRRAMRYEYLRAAYDSAGANTRAVLDSWALGGELGWNRDAIRGVVGYLVDSGKLRYVALGGRVSLTVAGIDTVESVEDTAPATYAGGVNVTADRGAVVQVAPHGSAAATSGAGDASAGPPPTPERAAAGEEPAGRNLTKRIIGFAGAVLASLLAAALWWAFGPDGNGPSGVEVALSNQVTNGSDMREDDTPLVLAYEPTLDCVRRPDCLVDKPTFATGDHLRVLCQTVRDRMTNGDDTSDADDNNPDLAESRLWYGTELDGDVVYVNEVYVAAGDRGGRGLPTCSRGR